MFSYYWPYDIVTLLQLPRCNVVHRLPPLQSYCMIVIVLWQAAGAKTISVLCIRSIWNRICSAPLPYYEFELMLGCA